MNFLTILSFLLATNITVFQHLPVKYPAVTYRSVSLKRYGENASCHFNGYEVLFRDEGENRGSIVVMSRNKRVQKFHELGFDLLDLPDSLLLADINGDGKNDLKIIMRFRGASPLARCASRKIYLLSDRDKAFTKVSFFDCSSEPERDFNGDRKYEIISRELQNYRGHSYWKYQVYTMLNGRLHNVSLKYHYPLLERFMLKPKRYSPILLNKYERNKLLSLLPPEYDQQ